MNRTAACVAIVLALAIALSGCSKPPIKTTVAQPPVAGDTTVLEAQNAGFRDLLANTIVRVRVFAEPKGDISEGLFMARVSEVVTSGASTAITVDALTDGDAPGTDSHVQNRYAHQQRIEFGDRADGPPNLVLVGPNGLEVVSESEFADRFARWRGADLPAYYVQVWDGRVRRLWPVAIP